MSTSTLTEIDTSTIEEIEDLLADRYAVIIWNDDVTTFETVVSAVVFLFGYEVDEAWEFAHMVDSSGKAVADVLPLEEAEEKVKILLNRYKIQATLTRA